MKPIRVLAVDDHPLLREGIAALINADPEMTLVAEASNGLDGIAQFRLHRPDITLMDLQMPTLDGIATIARIRAEFLNARIIVLMTYAGDAKVLRAMRAGAQAFLLKERVHKELLDAIRAVHSGRTVIAPEIATELAAHVMDDQLSFREIEVLESIANGKSNKEIAAWLAISETTVKSHVASILAKLGARDRTNAVTIALRRGIVEASDPPKG